MDMTPAKHPSSAHSMGIIEQKPVEADSFSSPRQEIEFVAVKEEIPEEVDSSPKQEIEYVVVKAEPSCLQEWEEPDSHESAQDPLSITEEECSPSEDSLVSSTFRVEEIQDGKHKEKAVDEDDGKEGFPGPSTFNVEKTEDEEDEDATSEDDWEEIKHEVELASGGGEPESSAHIGMEDDKSNDDSSSFVANLSLAAGTGNSLQCAPKQETAFVNEIGTRYLGHKSGIRKKTLQEMMEHMDIDSLGELRYSCSVCHKTYTTSSSLRRHMREHTGERPYICKFCNKAFKQTAHLKQHVRLHTNERPFKCGVCKKSFNHSNTLKDHSRLHTGIRPYSCRFCNRTFTHRTSLTQHLRLHTGERPYSCGICNKTFRHCMTLKDHLLLHSGKRQNKCGVCD